MKSDKLNNPRRTVIWLPTLEDDELIATAKSLNTSKSKLARAGIRRELARIRALKKK